MMIQLIMAGILYIAPLHASALCSKDPSCVNTIIEKTDTLPLLTSIADMDIDTITSSYKTKTVTITLKNGKVLVYNADWNSDEKLTGRMYEAFSSISKTFTKTEHPPAYPGGDTAWNNYLLQFYTAHQQALAPLGHGSVTVQFVVDIYGNLFDPEAISSSNSKLIAAAIEAVKDSAPWKCAIQNYHKVTSYQKAVVKF